VVVAAVSETSTTTSSSGQRGQEKPAINVLLGDCGEHAHRRLSAYRYQPQCRLHRNFRAGRSPVRHVPVYPALRTAFTILPNRTELAGGGGSIISPIPLRINSVASLDASPDCQESTERLIPSASILRCTLGAELMGSASTLDDPFDPFCAGLSRGTTTTYGLDMYLFSPPTSFCSLNPSGMELRSNDPRVGLTTHALVIEGTQMSSRISKKMVSVRSPVRRLSGLLEEFIPPVWRTPPVNRQVPPADGFRH